MRINSRQKKRATYNKKRNEKWGAHGNSLWMLKKVSEKNCLNSFINCCVCVYILDTLYLKLIIIWMKKCRLAPANNIYPRVYLSAKSNHLPKRLAAIWYEKKKTIFNSLLCFIFSFSLFLLLPPIGLAIIKIYSNKLARLT